MKLKKIISCALALSATVGCAGLLTACETSHPEVKMTVSFEGETYELEYKLYRKIAPATVKHFLYLADNGYYNGLCVHNYDDSRMYTGAYKFDANATEVNGGLVYQKYYDIVKNYGDFPFTVYGSSSKDEKLYTLYGEFSNNDFSVENGNKKETFGSLSMYYTDKTEDATVYIEHPEAGGSKGRSYKYNSATSQFFISLTTSEKVNANYCTFATLDGDSEDELKALQEAIDAYIEENEDNSKGLSVKVDEDEQYLGDDYLSVETYTVLASPIVINKVEVKKF